MPSPHCLRWISPTIWNAKNSRASSHIFNAKDVMNQSGCTYRGNVPYSAIWTASYWNQYLDIRLYTFDRFHEISCPSVLGRRVNLNTLEAWQKTWFFLEMSAWFTVMDQEMNCNIIYIYISCIYIYTIYMIFYEFMILEALRSRDIEHDK